MISIGADAALFIVGVAVTVVAAWGSSISIRSASRGPRWALEHLAAIRPYVFGAVVVGLLLTIAVSPLWTGLAVLYVTLTVLLMAAMLRRALVRLEEAGGLDELPVERRRQIVQRSRTVILIAGAVLTAIGLGLSSAGVGPIGWIPTVLGITLVVTALALSAETGRTG